MKLFDGEMQIIRRGLPKKNCVSVAGRNNQAVGFRKWPRLLIRCTGALVRGRMIIWTQSRDKFCHCLSSRIVCIGPLGLVSQDWAHFVNIVDAQSRHQSSHGRCFILDKLKRSTLPATDALCWVFVVGSLAQSVTWWCRELMSVTKTRPRRDDAEY